MNPLRRKALIIFLLLLLGVSNTSHSVVSPVAVSKPYIDSSIGVEDLDRAEFAARHYLALMSRVGAARKEQAETADPTSLHNMGHGAIFAKFGQALFGVEVFNRELNILRDQDHNMVAASGYFASVPVGQIDSPKLRSFGSTDEAFSAAPSVAR